MWLDRCWSWPGSSAMATSTARRSSLLGEDLRAVAARSVLMSYQGEVLSVDQTVGDIADPGVVIVLLYPGPPFRPTPLEGFHVLLAAVQHDADLAGKLERHLRSPDASLKARLDLEG